MPHFKSTIIVVVEANSEMDACDAMSAAMSENLQQNKAIIDWSYICKNGIYSSPRELSKPLITDESGFVVEEKNGPLQAMPTKDEFLVRKSGDEIPND